MKYRRLQLLSLFLVTAFIFSGPSQIKVTPGQTPAVETNFEAWLLTQSGSRLTEAYALYIKQAFAPLGIDVKIVAKPYGQFVGDLVHFTSGQPFDLAISRFSSGSPTPAFMWAYHSSQTSFGRTVYQLDNLDWQAWQKIDTGLDTIDIDALLEALEYEQNLTRKAELVDQFAELYMDKLLYDFPLVRKEALESMWAGYGGANNELWNADEGIYRSIALGAGWEDRSPAERAGDNETLRLSQFNPSSVIFDPMQGSDTATKAIIEPMSVNLLDFDFGFNAYPSIAYNFVNIDVVNFDVGGGIFQNVELGNFTYYLRDDAMWSATTDVNGVAIPAHSVDAKDFWFTYEIYQLDKVIVDSQQLFQSILGTEVSTTMTPNDTLKVYIDDGTYKPRSLSPDDFFTFGSINPMPYHILGGDLTFTNSSGTWVGDIYTLDSLGINVQNTDEWKHWASQAGYSLVGPYDLVSLIEGVSRTYSARADWFFPNEWDAAAYPTVEGGVFAAHQNSVNPTSINWAWADQGGNEKPTSPLITQIEHITMEDINAKLLAFEAGTIDHLSSTDLASQKVADFEADPRFVVKAFIPNRGPELLIFNLLHPDIKKINVRKAMAAMIDKAQLVKIHDGYAQPNDSPVWGFNTAWYKPYPVASSFEIARDLMRLEGYVVMDTFDPQPDSVLITETKMETITETVRETTTETTTTITKDTRTETVTGTVFETTTETITEPLEGSVAATNPASFFAIFGVSGIFVLMVVKKHIRKDR